MTGAARNALMTSTSCSKTATPTTNQRRTCAWWQAHSRSHSYSSSNPCPQLRLNSPRTWWGGEECLRVPARVQTGPRRFWEVEVACPTLDLILEIVIRCIALQVILWKSRHLSSRSSAIWLPMLTVNHLVSPPKLTLLGGFLYLLVTIWISG